MCDTYTSEQIKLAKDLLAKHDHLEYDDYGYYGNNEKEQSIIRVALMDNCPLFHGFSCDKFTKHECDYCNDNCQCSYCRNGCDCDCTCEAEELTGDDECEWCANGCDCDCGCDGECECDDISDNSDCTECQKETDCTCDGVFERWKIFVKKMEDMN